MEPLNGPGGASRCYQGTMAGLSAQCSADHRGGQVPEPADADPWQFAVSDVLLQLALFAADHALGSLAPGTGGTAGAPGDADQTPMTPFLASVADGRPYLTRFAGGVAQAKAAVPDLADGTDAYAIATDAWVTLA